MDLSLAKKNQWRGVEVQVSVQVQVQLQILVECCLLDTTNQLIHAFPQSISTDGPIRETKRIARATTPHAVWVFLAPVAAFRRQCG